MLNTFGVPVNIIDKRIDSWTIVALAINHSLRSCPYQLARLFALVCALHDAIRQTIWKATENMYAYPNTIQRLCAIAALKSPVNIASLQLDLDSSELFARPKAVDHKKGALPGLLLPF